MAPRGELSRGGGGCRAGVSAMPAFFINVRRLSGAQPLEKFVPLMDDAVVQARSREQLLATAGAKGHAFIAMENPAQREGERTATAGQS
jgi:hypothetical protein